MATRSGKDYLDVENKTRSLVTGIIVKNDFIFKLLEIYKFSKSKIRTLRDGNSLSKKHNQIISRNELLFESVNVGSLIEVDLKETFENLLNDPAVFKYKTRFVVATDYKTFLACDVKTNERLETPIEELADHWDFFLPWLGHEKYKVEVENQADVKAAEKMGQIYDEIVKSNPDFLSQNSRALNLFLTRLLFCFYAEDSHIFEGENLFTQLIDEHTDENGEGMNLFLSDLFASLDSSDKKAFPVVFQRFPYVNGSLFSERSPIPRITAKARKLILESGRQDWKEINPDIFGSMFQAVSESGSRGNLGQHYTSVPNIMKVIGPLFLDSLRDEFENVKDDSKKLRAFWDRIASIKFFDPACGSGNFLIIAYKQIRFLEIDVIKRLVELKDEYLKLKYSRIRLGNFHGLEIDDFARETAILSLWLAEHQMNMILAKELGEAEPTLPLKPGGNIAYANALRVDWNKFCPHGKDDEVYVFGNPPYLGRAMQTEEQKDDLKYVFAKSLLSRTSQNSLPVNLLDYVTCWFLLATLYITGYKKTKFAFVTTNSICQGEQIAALWPHIFCNPVEIEFAHTSFKWTNNAKYNAGVTCAIIGVRNKSLKPKFIISSGLSRSVNNINAYLNSGANVIVHKSKSSISSFPPMSFGSMPNDDGYLLLSYEQKEAIVKEEPKSSKFVRKLVGSQEFIKGINRWCLWVKEEEREEAEKNPLIRERFKAVAAFRAGSSRLQTQKLAMFCYRFGEVRHIDSTSIIIPRVSSERREYIPIGFLNSDSIISDSAQAIYNAPRWVFGVISSRMHMAWVRAIGGRLEERLRYSAELCYNTFPFPEINQDRRNQIENCVDKVLACRERHVGKTMAELYDSDVNDPSKDKMPGDLRMAHRELDRVIDQCYRAKPFASDEERLETLLTLYQQAVRAR